MLNLFFSLKHAISIAPEHKTRYRQSLINTTIYQNKKRTERKYSILDLKDPVPKTSKYKKTQMCLTLIYLFYNFIMQWENTNAESGESLVVKKDREGRHRHKQHSKFQPYSLPKFHNTATENIFFHKYAWS